tara:strand:- start:5366 stop:5545 length:180 start_codon:yes stop_codon:yes gene_type:complete
MSKLSDIGRQADDIQRWIEENCEGVLQDHRHLDAGTDAQAFYHLGRLPALRDVLRALSN